MNRPNIESGCDPRMALKVFMLASGLDSVSLAKKAGMKPTTLNRKMRGLYDFKLSEVKAVAKALELTPEETMRIFFGTE